MWCKFAETALKFAEEPGNQRPRLAAIYVESDHALAAASRAANHSTACLILTTPGTADKRKHRSNSRSVVCCKI